MIYPFAPQPPSKHSASVLMKEQATNTPYSFPPLNVLHMKTFIFHSFFGGGKYMYLHFKTIFMYIHVLVQYSILHCML